MRTERAQQRALLIQFRETGEIPDPVQHAAWLKDPEYAIAFRAVSKERAKGAVAPPAPKRPRGRPRKAIAPPAEPPPPKPPKPPKPTEPPGSPDEPVPEPKTPPEPERIDQAPPVIREEIRPGVKGDYTRIYVREGQELEPADPQPAPKPAPEPDFVPSVEVRVTSDADQKRLVDEYGELDRRMQIRAMDYARYEALKRAIKSWFDAAPADADGTVEGETYLLHLSARERERRIRDPHDLIEVIGIDKVLELASVPIGQLENLLGKARVAQLTSDSRTGSRRIKAIAKRPAGREVSL